MQNLDKCSLEIWFLSFKKTEVPVPPLCKENGSIGSTIVICE